MLFSQKEKLCKFIGINWKKWEKVGKDAKKSEKMKKDAKEAKHVYFFAFATIFFLIYYAEKRAGCVVWAYAHTTFPYSHWRAQREPSCPAGLKGMTKHKLDPSVRKKVTDPNARRKLLPLKVYCTKEERAVIEEQAQTAGMSVSEYLRRVGQGVPVQSRVDKQAVKELAKVAAALGRAGGLLKMLLKNEERLLGYTGAQMKTLTMATVKDMADMQSSLALISKRILKD